MDHEAIKELLESYALGALEPADRATAEAHLQSGCRECETAYRDLSSMAAQLAQTVPQRVPPPRLKEQILSRVRASGSRSRPRTGRGATASWIITGIAIAASLMALVRMNALTSEVSQLETALVESQDVTDLLNSPGMQFVDLKGVDPNPQAFGKVVVDPVRGAAVVYMYRLPQTPEGMEYQLWIMREGKPTSAGVFTVAEDGTAMLALKDFDDSPDAASFLVTIEPRGGEEVPTGMMYLTGPEVPPSDP